MELYKIIELLNLQKPGVYLAPKIRPSKSSFEKYKPQGLFSEFYGIR